MLLNYRSFVLLVAIIIVTATSCLAQEINLTIRDNSRKAMPGATIILINRTDSASLHTTTDLFGKAQFKNLNPGLYSLRISYVGFNTIEKNISVKEGTQQLDYRMTEKVVSLDEVTISAKRPLIRQEGDKTIIDPEPIAAISNNTLDVLESTPGLFVDQDGGIFLNSATPAVVYINGREQKLSTQDINNLLRSIPPESIQRIEILRAPSTKYDASSSGGIINIALKKGVKIGRFGPANAGLSQGTYGDHSVGFSLNNSGNKTTSYINANYRFNDGLEELNSVRLLATDTSLSQSARNRSRNKHGYVGYGLSYDISDNLSLNYDGRVNLNFRDASSKNNNQIETSLPALLLESDNFIDNKGNSMNIQQDFGITLKLDTIDSEWVTKISYSLNSNNSEQDYRTELLFPFNLSSSGDGNNTQNRNFIQLQSDLTEQLPEKIKLETGFKSSRQHYNSCAGFFNNSNGIKVEDALRTNTFNYTEAINSAYIQLSRPLFFKTEIKGGTRIEHTYMNGNQTVPTDTGFVINRTDWFPYLYLSRPLFEIFGVRLVTFLIYRKTINRPGYHSLNPYIRFVDQFMYETGNPALKPQFTDNYELNVSFNDMPVFAIGRNYTRDIFSSVVYRDKNQAGVMVRTYDNLGKNKETYFRFLGGIPPGGKYFFAIGSQYNLSEYDGIYENQPLIYKRGGWRLFTFHSLKLFKETRITMNAFMMLNGNHGFFELEDFGALNLGIRQSFMNNKLTITLNARDVLKTMVTNFELKQGSIPSYGSRYTDNRRIGLNIRYNFGIKKKEERKSLVPEELDN
jgi:hypothetical protein